MRKLLFLYLRITGAWQRLSRRVRGVTAEEIHQRRIDTGRAWEEFCDDLKAAGQVVLSRGTPDDPLQRVEGIRYLSRLTRAGLEAFVEYSDPQFPEFRRMVHETVKMGADNPDNYYLNAQISGTQLYKITGKRNTIDYISFHTQNGSYGSTGGLAPCGKLEDAELQLEEDGTFEIYLGPERRGKNWLKTEPETSLVMVRQTFADRTVEIPTELKLVNLAAPEKPAPFDAVRMDEGLKTASLFVGGASLLFTRWARGFKKHPNSLPLFDPGTSSAAGGDDSIVYYHSYWELEEDQMLVIDVDPPACDAWNFQLNNFWMESLDYRHFRISINKHTAVPETDGQIRVVVSHRDPGHPNWIETAHHRQGTMCWRWYRLHEGATAVQPRCRVLRHHETVAL